MILISVSNDEGVIIICKGFRNSYTSSTFYTFIYIMSHTCAMPTITYATLGTKWQIVIPKEARDKLHVWPGDKVVLMIEDGRLIIINPDGVQHMINILQEGMINHEQSENKKTEKKKIRIKKTEKKK